MAFEADGIVYLELDDAIECSAAACNTSAENGRNSLRGSAGAAALESALSRPRHHAAYGDRSVTDIATLAAALAHGISESQCFIDGNKRTSLVAMTMFLALNAYSVEMSAEELADWIVLLTERHSIDELSDRLRGRLVGPGEQLQMLDDL